MPPSSATPDYYAVLEVAQGASDQDINTAYRRLARIHHPDKNPGNEEAATAMFQKIQAAFETLSNPSKRQAYDWSYQPTLTTASSPSGSRRQYNWYTDPAVPPRRHNCYSNPHPHPPPRQYNRHTNPRPYNPDYDPDGSFDEVPDGWGRPDPPRTYHIPKPKPKNQSSPISTPKPNNPPRATSSSTSMPNKPRGAPEPWESAEDPALYGDPDAYWNPEARREVQAEHAARQREYEREVEEEWGGVGGGGDGGVFGPSPSPPPPQPRPRAGDFPPQPQTFHPPAPDFVSGSGSSVRSDVGTRQNPIDRIPTPSPPPGTWGEQPFPGKAKHVYDPADPFQRGGCGGKRQPPPRR